MFIYSPAIFLYVVARLAIYGRAQTRLLCVSHNFDKHCKTIV